MFRSKPDHPVLKVTLLLASSLIAMAGATIAPALPAMQAHFADVEGAAFLVRLVLTLPALFIALVAPIAGYVVDRIGRKKVLVASTLVYALAGAGGYLAPTLTLLLASRGLLGIAVGGLMTSVTTLIADYFEGPARSRFMGLQAGFMGLGGTAFLALGGVLAESGWRGPFIIYFAAFLVLPLVYFVLYEPSAVDQCAEVPNPVADTADCVAESLRAERVGVQPTQVTAATPVRLVVFVYSVMVALQVVFYLVPVQLPFYLVDLTGASASQSGLAISLMAFFFAASSLQYGRIAARLDHLSILIIAFALIGAGYVLIALAGSWALIVAGLMLAGSGLGMMAPNLNVWLADETPPVLRGRVLGGLTTAIFLGQFLSPIVGQPVIAAIGFTGLFLAAGAVVLGFVPVSLATRKQLRLLAG